MKEFLDAKVEKFNCPDFIENDPISIPHRYTRKQDIEIAGLFAAVLAWGQRGTIIKKCSELMELMDNDPYGFVLHHRDSDLKGLTNFRHRTFNGTDALYFIEALRTIYKDVESMEELFLPGIDSQTVEPGLIRFHHTFFGLEHHPHRTKKHLSTPEKKSTCKRLNMFLRWMVRRDHKGVDFGLWQRISPSQLVCPCDVHVDRVARELKLIRRKQTDWFTTLELTASLREFEPVDPVKYDFALFGLGVEMSTVDSRRSAAF